MEPGTVINYLYINSLHWEVFTVQEALVIRGFAIRGFDYPRLPFCDLNLVSADFPSVIHGFKTKLTLKPIKSVINGLP